MAAGHRHHRGAEKLHTPDVRRLPFHIDRAHVDHAGHSQARGRGCARDPMLPRARFGDDALGAQALGQQGLADGVVDFVRTRVREIFALEPDLRAPALAQSRGERQCGRAAHPGLELMVELGQEFGVMQIALDAHLQPVECGHQCLGNITSAKGTVASAGIRKACRRGGGAQHFIHESFSTPAAAARAARTNS
jgi:hypothetical protein